MFITRSSIALSIGATAVLRPLSNRVVPSGNPSREANMLKSTHARIINTHASQTLYAKKKGTTITSSNADVIVPAGKEIIFALDNTDSIQLIASGASTTGTLDLGTPD